MGKSHNYSPSSSRYEGLLFEFSAIRDEITSFVEISRKFIDPSYEYVLLDWLDKLMAFQNSRQTGSIRWEITEKNPVRTQPTLEYEPVGKCGGFEIYGELSSIWQIELVADANRKNRVRFFRLKGIASTKIKIFRLDLDQSVLPIAQWQFEVGDHQSPGTHFHVGIGFFGQTATSLPVPRLPSLIFTPVDALDFLLGEMFQVRWRREVSLETASVRTWTGHQRERLSRLLGWKLDQVKKSNGSAWNYLKHERPPASILLK
jgi:hypothetical protein